MKKFIIGLMLLLTAGCASQHYKTPGVITFNDTNSRITSQQTFFAEERKRIAERRDMEYGTFPVTGLALSGGGIRSNAFQLGVLSGLKKRLNNIDYVSAVSGGSWAAGAYKVSKKEDDELFAELDAEVFNKIERPKKPILLSDYDVAEKVTGLGLIPTINPIKKLDHEIGSTARDEWQQMIKENFLQGKDPYFHEVEKDSKRPIIIVNASHNAVYFLGSSGTDNAKVSFPFEFSAHFVGTIADCGNTDYCGIFRYLKNKDYGGAYVDPSYGCNRYFRLSKALAASGAVTPRKILGLELNLLNWRVNLHDPYSGQKLPNETNGFRETYDLTDGGQSDNLGILPLLERGVSRIIVSDEAYDPNFTFGDLEAVASHATKLLGVTITLENMKIEGVDNIRYLSQKIDNVSPITKGSFTGTSRGDILYIKPTRNIDAFMVYLREGKFCTSGEDKICKDASADLYDYLHANKQEIGFPFNKTMEGSYDKRLIYAFYLLGKYIAEIELPNFENGILLF